TIKPTPPDEIREPSGGTSGNDRYRIHNRTLKDYIWRAWLVVPERVVGGPVWLDTDRWNIEAKAAHPAENDDAMMAMLRTLREERFHLKLHRETRTAESLFLKVAKDGPKLGPAIPGEAHYHNAHNSLAESQVAGNRSDRSDRRVHFHPAVESRARG